jgi:hypothetical protein
MYRVPPAFSPTSALLAHSAVEGFLGSTVDKFLVFLRRFFGCSFVMLFCFQPIADD